MSAVEKRFLGNDQFIDQIKKVSHEPFRHNQRTLRRLKNSEELMTYASKTFAVDRHEIEASDQARVKSRIRQTIAYVGRRLYRFAAIELGQCLKRDGTTIGQILRRNEQVLAQTGEVRRLVAELET